MRNNDNTAYYGPMFPEARKAMILIHGRGSNGGEMANSFEGNIPTAQFYIAAPSAPEQSWYPKSFLAPKRQNEPMLSNSLAALQGIMKDLKSVGFATSDIYLLGFSQGACLALEFAARNACKFGGVFALSGGLIGDELDTSIYRGDFENTPIFIGCSDIDSHVPLSRVQESTRILKRLGAMVTEKIYPGMGHTVNTDELREISRMINLQAGSAS